MKHTIQYGVQSQPDGSVQVRVECTCGVVFAEERAKTASVFNRTSADIKARLWKVSESSTVDHMNDVERGLRLHEGLNAS